MGLLSNLSLTHEDGQTLPTLRVLRMAADFHMRDYYSICG